MTIWYLHTVVLIILSNWLTSSVGPIDKMTTGTTNRGPRGPGSVSNEGVLHTPRPGAIQSYTI